MQHTYSINIAFIHIICFSQDAAFVIDETGQALT